MIGSFIKMILLILLAGFVGGTFWYAGKIPAAPSTYEKQTDAIIVLTGGGKRLGKGFRLLGEHKGKELLITGVGKGVTLAELLAQQQVDSLEDALDARAISLDYAAISTATNATAAEEWMKNKGFTTARLVTANYHMPRALLEFSEAMPGIEFIPDPVFPDQEFTLDGWYLDPKSIKLLATEYLKFMVTSLKQPTP